MATWQDLKYIGPLMYMDQHNVKKDSYIMYIVQCIFCRHRKWSELLVFLLFSWHFYVSVTNTKNYKFKSIANYG